MNTYGITAAELEKLNVTGYFTNLLPVTIGNLIGGAVFVGAIIYYMSKEKK